MTTEALLAANERLRALREQLKGERAARGEGGEVSRPEPAPKQRPAGPLLPHLGWESAPLTAHLLAAHKIEEPEVSESLPLEPEPEPEPEPESEPSLPPAESITLYPALALALLKQHQAAAGRVWLLLRWLDRPGRGVISIAEARHQLTDCASPYRFCGWRQLRNLLRAGEGLFWRVANEQIWLSSLLKVSGRVGVEKFRNHPVELPVSVLLGPIADVRANLHVSFHSGRDGNYVGEVGRPIARATLQQAGGSSRSSQRRYERRTKTKVVTNYAIGEVASPENVEQRASLQGNATFKLKDYQGKIGRPNQEYVAWQLPNSYSGPHAQRPKGQRQRRLNDGLAALRDRSTAGNGRPERKRYFGNGKEAGKSYNRDSEKDCLWPGRETAKGKQIWWCISGRK